MFRTYPIPVDAPGTLRLMPCPSSGELRNVIDHLGDSGVNVILSMLPPDEAAALGVQDEPDICAARGITFLSHPIVDFGLPDRPQFDDLIVSLAARLRQKDHIAVHCRAGIGRSGMVAAATLIALGQPAQTARQTVSAARGVSIPDTVEQGNFIAEFAQSFKSV